MRTLALTEQDSGREVAAQVGDEIRVTLDENPTTGYRWTLAPMTPGVLELRHTRFSAAAGAGIGGGGTRTFSLMGIAPGRTAVEFQLRQPWGRDAPSTPTFRLLVTVQ